MIFDDDFEWDDPKYKSNIDKHKLKFEEAMSIWLRPDDLIIRQDPHVYIAPAASQQAQRSGGEIAQATGKQEIRYIALGLIANGRLLVVVYTLRGEKIRLISARKANSRERKRYEKIRQQGR